MSVTFLTILAISMILIAAYVFVALILRENLRDAREESQSRESGRYPYIAHASYEQAAANDR